MQLDAEIAPSGEVPARGMDVVLAWCAAQRFTGVLTYEHGAVDEVVPLRAGAVDLDEEGVVAAALARLRAASVGRYALTEALPPLEGASADHPLRREGALGPATFADLLRWCDDVALTGTVHLTVARPDARTHAFQFERGALCSVELESWGDDGDLGAVFATAEGRFVVRMRSRFGRATPSQAPASDDARARREALRAVQHGLEALLARRDAASSGRWRRASVRPPSIAPTPAAPALAPRTEPSSVLVYYVDHRPAPARKAAASDRTERLAPLELPPRPRPSAIALCVLGLVGAAVAGFGLAAGVEYLFS
jgi:hypothetical protein